MKKIYIMLLTLASAAMALTSCSDKDDAYFTAGPDDFPRILNTDLPDWEKGHPGYKSSISRDVPFKYEAIVTPADYTTVNYYCDGVMIHEGKNIDTTLLAGTHVMKIQATTVKGKQVSRTFYQEVTPLDTDPSFASDAKSRWFQIGSTMTITGDNIADIKAIYLTDSCSTTGKQNLYELPVTENTGSAITFSIPETLAAASYSIIAETSNGTRFGCGECTVSTDKYVDPGVKTTVAFEGRQNIDWDNGDCLNIDIEENGITAGSKFNVYYEIVDADYHAAKIVTGYSWKYQDIMTQLDGLETLDGMFTLEITQEIIDKCMDDAGKLLISGHGYAVTKIEIETGVAPAEVVAFEGDQNIDWDNGDCLNISVADNGITAGKTVTIYYDIVDADYHAAKIVTGYSWKYQDIMTQIDGLENLEGTFTLDITQEIVDKCMDDAGMLLISGHGYKVKKVTVK